MPKFKSQFHPTIPLTGRHWRSAIYLGLLGLVLLVTVPWSIIASPFTGLLVGLLLVGGIVVWMQLKIHYLQSRMHRLEHQMHRLSHQPARSNLNRQSISHLEAEQYFSQEQTRH